MKAEAGHCSPNLILISGWAHDSSALEELCQCLEKATNISTLATANLWSAETKTALPSSYAQNLARMIEKTGGRAFIGGWSLGGMIALETAALRPDLVAGLILISSTAKFRAGQNWAAGVSGNVLRAMTAMLKRNPRGVLASFFQNVAQTLEEKIQALGTKAENHEALWARLEETIKLKIERACAMNPLELTAGLAYLSETDLRQEALKINVPTLVLHGQQDAIIPVEAGLALKNLLPLSKICVYENCGHGLPWQAPRAIAADIIKFLEECRNRNIKNSRRLSGCSKARLP